MDWILFWTAAAAIGQIVGALATAAAVIVSLWITLDQRRDHLKLTVGKRIVIEKYGPQIDVISFHLTNIGTTLVRVSNFGWRTGWLGRGPKALSFRYAIQMPSQGLGSQDPPFDLEPGRSATFLVDLTPAFEADEARDDLFGPRRLGPFGLCPPKVTAWVSTARGTQLFARVERQLAEELTRVRLERWLEASPEGSTLHNEHQSLP